MTVSDRGIALVREFEGFSPTAYDDVAGKQTIGIGHLIRANETFGKLSESDAVALLCRDLEDVEACLADLVEAPLTQNQYDALASWIFNLGRGAFERSTLLRKLNLRDYDGAAEEFPKWSYARVRGSMTRVDGLLRRRLAEQLLFRAP